MLLALLPGHVGDRINDGVVGRDEDIRVAVDDGGLGEGFFHAQFDEVGGGASGEGFAEGGRFFVATGSGDFEGAEVAEAEGGGGGEG